MTSSSHSSIWGRPKPSTGGGAKITIRLEGKIRAKPLETSVWSVRRRSTLPSGRIHEGFGQVVPGHLTPLPGPLRQLQERLRVGDSEVFGFQGHPNFPRRDLSRSWGINVARPTIREPETARREGGAILSNRSMGLTLTNPTLSPGHEKNADERESLVPSGVRARDGSKPPPGNTGGGLGRSRLQQESKP